ncbi:hypothetical protein RFI_10872 [Reticulomyxa filosa]|uniref:Uncharacterized protein n=1 Tax=Reticulomyxa filosa TaxID=46433 RepID=X6NJW1_RETFI|nr:hypothetical protein RFI_10872 [Reticulomyxa filosa]|eukprot:ETO26266.1 hypothetical protein RFI_10872 [Reticulomyxa filosa]
MDPCFLFLFPSLELSYQDSRPPPESPDKHLIPFHWHWLIGFLYSALVIVQWTWFGGIGNLLFFPASYLTALAFYQIYNKKCLNQQLNPDQTKFSDLYRAFCHCVVSSRSFFSSLQKNKQKKKSNIYLYTQMNVEQIEQSGEAHFIQSAIYTLIITGGNVKQMFSFFCFVFSFLAFVCVCVLGKDSGWKTQTLTLINAFVIAGMTEEMTKGMVLQHCAKLYLPHSTHLDGSFVKTFVWMGLAVGLGFGTMEGILYTCLYGMNSGIFGQLIILLIRIFLAIPLHALTGSMRSFSLKKRIPKKKNPGAIWGIEFSRRECLHQQKSWFELSFKQILWHGLYDYVEMEYSLFTPANDLYVALLGLALGYIIVAIALFATRRDYKKLTLNEFSRLPQVVQIEEITVSASGTDQVTADEK